MIKKIKHASAALFVFLTLSGVFLWLTVREPSVSATTEANHAGHEEEDKRAESSEEEHGHDDHNETVGDLSALEKQFCEHKKRTVDCDNCRFELGVVKIEPSVAKSLISTGIVEERPAVVTLHVTGEVQFDQTRMVEVPSVGSGRVIRVNAFLGQQVKAGDILAVIQSADFGEAKAAYLKAYTNLEISHKEQERQTSINAALEKLLASLSDGQQIVWEREFINGGNEFQKELIGEWKSKLGAASARLKLARSVYEREKDLWTKQISSKSDYETASQELQAAQAEYASLLEEVQLNLRLNKLRADNAARQAEAELAAAEQRLHTFGLNDAAIQALPHSKNNGDFARLEVKAPRTGTIIAQNISEGKQVDTTQSLYTIADLSNLWVWCNLYEKDIAILHDRLSEGNPPEALVRVAAFKDAAFSGKVDLIGSAVDEQTRTIKVRIQVKNEQAKLKPGMFANVEILISSPETGSGEQIIAVPQDAVVSDGGKSFVFQHLRDDLWVRRDVKLGRKQGRYMEILDGISQGAKVVTVGGFMLKSDILRVRMCAGCAD